MNKNKADVKKLMSNAFQQDVMEKMLRDALRNFDPNGSNLVIDGIIDTATMIGGPDRWKEADPVTVAVKIPESIINIAFIMRDECGVNTAEFLEHYVERLMFLGIGALIENVQKYAQNMVKTLIKEQENKNG